MPRKLYNPLQRATKWGLCGRNSSDYHIYLVRKYNRQGGGGGFVVGAGAVGGGGGWLKLSWAVEGCEGKSISPRTK